MAANTIKEVANQAKEWVQETGTTKVLAGGVAALLTASWIKKRFFRSKQLPPHVPSVPFFGNIVAFGERPIDFLSECVQQYGPIFSFTMFGTEVTYLMGSVASERFWNSHNDDLNAEDLYANITRPVFGKGVAYDVPHKIFSEQKQISKRGLTHARFQRYTAVIENETADFFQKWGEKGETDLYHDMAELIIYTATSCLHGKECRSQFTEEVSRLYHDLDDGFSPLAWFFPSWVPFPSFIRRDRAHIQLKDRFKSVIQGRIDNNNVEGNDDMLETFMTAKYEKVLDGRPFNENETSGLLIAMLMAGQHTSSTVASWLGFFIARDPQLQQELHDEQIRVLGEGRKEPITLEEADKMVLLWACVRETLRLRPPIMTMMRKCRKSFTVNVDGREYLIPKGNQVCVSPTVNGRLSTEWDDPLEFNPRRFLDTNEQGETIVTQGQGKGGKYKWVPFGAGRHRCIGFEFAQIQIRAVWSWVIRNYVIQLKDGKFPEINYRTMIHTPLNPYITYEKRH